MALESATYISQLVPANPPASDPIAQAASHLSLIKTVLQDTFPHANAPITATVENLNNGTPVGLIAMWCGTSIPAGWAICNGQVVPRSDGTGNVPTPDLRDRFVVGAGASYPVQTVGGVAINYLNNQQLPLHNHGVQDNGHGHGITDGTHAHEIVDLGHGHNMPQGGWAQAGKDNGGASALSPANQYGTYSGSTVNTNNSNSNIGMQPATSNVSVNAGQTGIVVEYAGAGAAVENRPPFYAVYYIMKV